MAVAPFSVSIVRPVVPAADVNPGKVLCTGNGKGFFLDSDALLDDLKLGPVIDSKLQGVLKARRCCRGIFGIDYFRLAIHIDAEHTIEPGGGQLNGVLRPYEQLLDLRDLEIGA